MNRRTLKTGLLLTTALLFAACGDEASVEAETQATTNAAAPAADSSSVGSGSEGISKVIDPSLWPELPARPLDPEVEARVDDLLSRMTLEQKVGQVIQGDTNSLTPEDVKTYRLGSVLSGGNSAPGDKPYAETQAWLDAADAYYLASLDPEGVEVAIPTLWGIDAVHGHTNLVGTVVYPHNVGLGAARDPDLVKRIAEATAVALNVSGHDWTFAPTLAVPQNDRWGRGYEGFSEDPAITKSYGGAIVEGLQGVWGSEEFMSPGRVLSTAKHFLGDGGTYDGVDQGDARISQEELRDIHLPGYETAIAAGTQSVMASFSAWQGQPMHGQKELLTDVLKGRMNFTGFVIGDWNGHALIPGCTATDCPQSLNAGLDMYMAPDSWKGLYESTLRHVNEGTIPMERLDDAVRRILRVKVQSGLFESVKPSDRPLAGDTSLIATAEHRALAREAVRKSLVLLKNNDETLPLNAGANVHVVGLGADSITKLSGGWTLSWQGRDHVNEDFPNGETFLAALQREVGAAGGRVTFDVEGASVPDDADVVIAVYGEDPYAEFQGDRDNVDFVPNDFDTSRLAGFRDDLPVVSVFISGRPLWTNPEMNASDAFVAAWLPGSEPAGIVDLLFQTDPSYEFTGRLSFSWPKLATQAVLNPHHDGYDPLFELGYGLTLADDVDLPALSEDSGIEEAAMVRGVFFEKGSVMQPFRLRINESPIDLPENTGGISVSAFDRAAQEDSLRVSFADDGALFSIGSAYPLDYAREANGAMELSFGMRSLSGPTTVTVGAGCIEIEGCDNFHAVDVTEEWEDYRISLSCAKANGVDLQYLKTAFAVRGESGQDIAISDVKLGQESAGSLRCE